MKFEHWHSSEEKHRYKLVRTDFFGPKGGEIPGDIVTADEITGDCNMHVAGESKPLSLGPFGFRIVRR